MQERNYLSDDFIDNLKLHDIAIVNEDALRKKIEAFKKQRQEEEKAKEELVKHLNALEKTSEKKDGPRLSFSAFDGGFLAFKVMQKFIDINIKPFDSRQARVAMLVGGAHVLSLLPILYDLGIHIVLINDTRPLMHQHMRLILDCLKEAKSIHHFYELLHEKDKVLVELLFLERFYSSESDLFQFNSPQLFKLYQQAAKKLQFAFSSVDLLNKDECTALEGILRKHQATVEILNVAYLYYYDQHNVLPKTTDIILSRSTAPHVIFQHETNLRSFHTTVRPKEGFYQAINFERARLMMNVSYKNEESESLVKEGNKRIAAMAKGKGIDDLAVIPVLISYNNGYFRLDCKLTAENTSAQYKLFNEFRNELLKEIAPLTYGLASELPKAMTLEKKAHDGEIVDSSRVSLFVNRGKLEVQPVPKKEESVSALSMFVSKDKADKLKTYCSSLQEDNNPKSLYCSSI